MRRIGRRRSESSPVIVLSNGWPARMPASRRMVVPEFPASSAVAPGRKPPSPRPAMVTVAPPPPAAGGSTWTSTPSVRRHRRVDAQSAPGA